MRCSVSLPVSFISAMTTAAPRYVRMPAVSLRGVALHSTSNFCTDHSRKYENRRSAHRRDRSRPGFDAASTDVQASGAHPPLELLLTCDDSVSRRSAFVLSS